MDEEIDPLLDEEKTNTPEDSPFNGRKSPGPSVYH